MQRVCAILIGIVLALGLATAAQAQTQGGEQELGFLAVYSQRTEGDSDGFLIANLRYGVFVTEAVQVGGGVRVGGSVENLDEPDVADIELFGKYYFSPAEVQTFYVSGGYSAGVDELADGFVEALFGWKSYFNERAAFFWEGGYGHPIGDLEGGRVISQAGITFQF